MNIAIENCHLWLISPFNIVIFQIFHRFFQMFTLPGQRSKRPDFPSPSTAHGEVRSLALSPDGSLFASGAADSSVRLWALNPSGLRSAGSRRSLEMARGFFVVKKIVYTCMYIYIYMYKYSDADLFQGVWSKNQTAFCRSRLTKTDDGGCARKLSTASHGS